MNSSDVCPLLAPRPQQAPDVVLRVQPMWHGQPVGQYRWRRIEAAASHVAQFVPDTSEVASQRELAADRVHLARLRLFAHGTPPGHEVPVGPFELQHSLTERTCGVNGRRIPAGRREPLHAGDEVQVGMLRLNFVAPQAQDDWWVPRTEDAHGAPAPLTEGSVADQAVGGPLEIHDALTDGALDAEVRDLCASAAQETGVSESNDGHAVLDELHRRYRATLDDPAEMGGHAQWRDVAGVDRNMGVEPDCVDALVRQAGGYNSLHDILATPDTMDKLIAQADALGEGDMLSDVRVDSVLHLFASSSAHGPRAVDEDWWVELMRLRPAASGKVLSSLTRREHHVPAADSALRLDDAGREAYRG